ncbi:MAG: type II toxin-antitoxin system RelE/ParE family toxin [Acidobacteriaceae bacterium]|nr:type II toxin-antitoxin system RelE/ParE family toxin [Acidobacteriaceae bacterium]
MELEWSFYAISDREAIFDYLEAESPRAAVDIDDRIETQVETLTNFPEIRQTGKSPRHA